MKSVVVEQSVVEGPEYEAVARHEVHGHQLVVMVR